MVGSKVHVHVLYTSVNFLVPLYTFINFSNEYPSGDMLLGKSVLSDIVLRCNPIVRKGKILLQTICNSVYNLPTFRLVALVILRAKVKRGVKTDGNL